MTAVLPALLRLQFALFCAVVSLWGAPADVPTVLARASVDVAVVDGSNAHTDESEKGTFRDYTGESQWGGLDLKPSASVYPESHPFDAALFLVPHGVVGDVEYSLWSAPYSSRSFPCLRKQWCESWARGPPLS